MKAAEKLYVNICDHLTQKGYYAFTNKVTEDDIEYVYKDAFIEKACEFLDGVIYDYIELKHANIDTFIDVDNKRFIKDFKKYMKGE